MQNIIYDRPGRRDKILINDDTARTIYNSCADDCDPDGDGRARGGRREISPLPHSLRNLSGWPWDMEEKRGCEFVLYCRRVANPSSNGN